MPGLSRLIFVIALATTSLAAAVAAQTGGLPEGPGKQALMKTCTSCHDEGTVISSRRTKDGWDGIVNDMVTRGASASDQDFDAIVQYLTKNFGKVNVNAASSGEIADVLGVPAEQAQAIVGYREKNGKFTSVDQIKTVPGVDGTLIEGKRKLIALQ